MSICTGFIEIESRTRIRQDWDRNRERDRGPRVRFKGVIETGITSSVGTTIRSGRPPDPFTAQKSIIGTPPRHSREKVVSEGTKKRLRESPGETGASKNRPANQLNAT
ncbi:hypothetical protein EVAR_63468_1 [Eumeta japonica]|uniref:Uncharacterized protein n=1 Tax=Eumeta variegata TaxID=151549 RepID=A0A4C1YEL9_EUMVA|nr:hypothetical protein EVAR_63468_1 [Eumeta japonica]